jgi:hypothetical protein
MNAFATPMGCPMAILSSLASSSMFSSSKSANLFMHAARCAPVNFFHGPLKAALAANTAASISSGPATWTSSVTLSSVAGFMTVRVSPDLDLTNWTGQQLWWQGRVPCLIVDEETSLDGCCSVGDHFPSDAPASEHFMVQVQDFDGVPPIFVPEVKSPSPAFILSNTRSCTPRLDLCLEAQKGPM